MEYPRTVSIFHYHLLPGGVTSVIALSCEALCRHLPDLERITLVTGAAENSRETANAVRSATEASGVAIETAVLPQIGYTAGMPSPPSTEEIKQALAPFRGSFWWIHNYHLGKNPRFTQSLLEILQADPAQQVLFHIHDFPECARYENLQRLNSELSLNPYPRRENIRYALINERDRELLNRSGLPGEDLFLLSNPVRAARTAEGAEPPDRKAVRRRLADHFGRGTGYDPEALHIFYPVRTIRRKNILETGMLTRLAAARLERPCNLIVTLPGVSETERRYSAAVEASYIAGHIPGLWGIGRHLEEAGIAFSDLGRSCDLMAASSVQEGFGYLFVESLQWGLPLVARNLEILDGMRHLFEGGASRFYDRLSVPVPARTAAALRDRYRRKLSRLADHLPSSSLARLDGEIGAIGENGRTDFALFDVESQQVFLAALDSEELTSACLELNRSLFETLPELITRRPDPDTVREAEEMFSFSRFADQTRRIFASFNRAASRRERPADEAGSQEPMIDAFARIEYLLLLYDYNGS